MVLNVKDLLQKAKQTENVPVAVKNEHKGVSKPSLSVVYNKNSKRVTLTAGLADALSLEESVDFFPLVEDGILLVAKKLNLENVSTGKINDGGKRICYSEPISAMIVKAFSLDYTKCTSKAFDEISLDEIDGIKVAAVKIK
ncbi:MAG: hypothetical protein IJA05_06180 [Oscillospiraceae bacterium]|nr:hypothetical protein [Oscillospiraceae bacterium]